MENKKKETNLEESIEKIEVRDFSLVWNDIKDRVVPQKRKRAYNWRFLATAIATFVIICSVVIPLSIKHFSNSGNVVQSENSSLSTSAEQTYFVDELSTFDVENSEFFDQLSLSNINIVDISKFNVLTSRLFKTVDQEIKGGQIELTDDLDNPSFVFLLKVYDKSVKLNDVIEEDYDLTYYIQDIKIEYRIREAYPEDSLYIYDIKTYFNNVYYYLEYTTSSPDITTFLNDFFK